MTSVQPILGVQDVSASSTWYQALLNCDGSHGGEHFEMLTNEQGDVFLCLHKWGEHEHPTLDRPSQQPGNGLILYLHVDDLKKTWKNAQALNVNIDEPPHMNKNAGKEQFCIRDLDGYYLMITS